MSGKSKKLRGLWFRLLKAEVEHDTQEAARLERKMIKRELKKRIRKRK